MIRIAAVGDVHYGMDSKGRLGDHMEEIARQADVLLIAGDLTKTGKLEEARVLAEDLARARFPVVTVFGNHDLHNDQEKEIQSLLEGIGVIVLEGNAVKLKIRDKELGIAGVKGFGGGFPGGTATDFGEREMKDFVRHTKERARVLRSALASLDTGYKAVLLHYSPTPDTLLGERKEIYPFLGSYMFSEVIDEIGADVVFHGHAHKGVEKGNTFGGIPVRNVAQPVIRRVCNIYTLNKEGLALNPENIGSEQHAYSAH